MRWFKVDNKYIHFVGNKNKHCFQTSCVWVLTMQLDLKLFFFREHWASGADAARDMNRVSPFSARCSLRRAACYMRYGGHEVPLHICVEFDLNRDKQTVLIDRMAHFTLINIETSLYSTFDSPHAQFLHISLYYMSLNAGIYTVLKTVFGMSTIIL